MFRKPIRIQRPDLRDEVHERIDQVSVTGLAESMPVEELLRVLGLRVAPDFHGSLQRTETLRYEPVEEIAGGVAAVECLAHGTLRLHAPGQDLYSR